MRAISEVAGGAARGEPGGGTVAAPPAADFHEGFNRAILETSDLGRKAVQRLSEAPLGCERGECRERRVWRARERCDASLSASWCSVHNRSNVVSQQRPFLRHCEEIALPWLRAGIGQMCRAVGLRTRNLVAQGWPTTATLGDIELSVKPNVSKRCSLETLLANL